MAGITWTGTDNDDTKVGTDEKDMLNGGRAESSEDQTVLRTRPNLTDNDIIFGGAGVDMIFGWDGDDRIIGGGGVGTGGYKNLYVGEGNDTFVFKAGDGIYNSIRDFTDGDKIDFIGLKFSDLTIEHGNYSGPDNFNRYAKITFGDGDVVCVNGPVQNKGLSQGQE